MPPVIPAIAAAAGAIASAGSIGAVTFFGLASGWAAVGLYAASSMALSALSSALSKPKSSGYQSFSTQATNRTLQLRQPITSRRIVYGETRVGGVLIFGASTESNRFLHLVLVLAAHEVESIDEIWVNDDIIPNDYLDGSGNVTQGKFAGYMRIKKHLGSPDQLADSDLVAEVTEWTSAHRGRGHAYIYIRMEGNRDVFQNGNPNFSVVLRGSKINDTRTDATIWSPNAALQSYAWLTDTKYGIEASPNDTDSDNVSAQANACEEIVDVQAQSYDVSSIDASSDIITLSGDQLMLQRGDQVEWETNGVPPTGIETGRAYFAIPYQFAGIPRVMLADTLDDSITSTAVTIDDGGSGTHTLRKTGEPRYFGGGMVETSATLGDNLRDILSGMGGTAVNIGGTWNLFAAIYRAPTITLTEHNLRAPVEIQTRLPQRERFNTVKGIFVAPYNNWQPADYPAISNSSYVAADDGRVVMQDIDLPFAQRAHTAQRLAKIALEKARREMRGSWPCTLAAIQLQPADTAYIDFEAFGWDVKVFEVDSFALVLSSSGGVPSLGVDLDIKEVDAAVFNWSASEEGGITPASRTNLPDAFTVTIILGFSLDSIPVFSQAGDKTYKIKASWDLHENNFVRQGGKIQIRMREVGTSEWNYVPDIDGFATQTELFQASLGVLYDIDYRALNNLGRPSAWGHVLGFSVGSTLITDTEDWENETLARDGTDWESDTESSEDWEA